MAKTSIISIAKLVVLNLFHIFATTVDSTAVEKNLLIMKFYNREKEIAELKRVQELAFGQNSRMIVVTGRRRIGKTSLIKQALKGTPTVYFFIGRKAESILVADFIKIVRETLSIFIPDGNFFIGFHFPIERECLVTVTSQFCSQFLCPFGA